MWARVCVSIHACGCLLKGNALECVLDVDGEEKGGEEVGRIQTGVNKSEAAGQPSQNIRLSTCVRATAGSPVRRQR